MRAEAFRPVIPLAAREVLGMAIRPLAVALVALAFVAPPLVAASHNDGTYDVPNWFQWGRRTIDVLVVPPGHGAILNSDGVLAGDPVNEVNPLTNSYMRATIDSIDNWQLAIDTYAPAWLKNGLTINVDVLPQDTPMIPTAYEIVVVSDETKFNILGIAIIAPTGQCVVDNSKILVTSFTYEDFFNINAQEYGHCLGLGHVQDNHPQLDAMNGAYPHNPGASNNPLHCVSNLDVKGLEGVFARTLGQPSSLWGATGRVSVGAYDQVPC